MACSEGPQVGFEPWATAARTQPSFHLLFPREDPLG